METKKETKKNTRLLSLDTLRGFDMLFIMGFAPLVVALNALHPTAVGDVIAGHMRHVPWDGFTQYDIPLVLVYRRYIFPVFIGQAKGERIERQTYLPEGFPPGCHPRFAGILV